MAESRAEKIVKTIGISRINKVFKFIRSIYLILDFVLNLVIGYSLVHGWAKDKIKAKNAGNQGHLMKIIGRCTQNLAGTYYPSNFMLRHESYIENPIDFVLNNDNVTLMGMSKTKAWFCVTSDYDIYNMDKFPFAFINQFFNSEKLLMMDHATLHSIADSIEDLQGNCVIINNTGRCGSTLLCQMMKKVPKTKVMSEPWGLLFSHRLYIQNQLTWPEYEKLIETLTKLQFKASKNVKTDNYILKLPLMCSAMMKPIQDIFGSKIKIILSTRHPKPSMISFAKVFQMTDIGKIQKFWLTSLGLPYTQAYKSILQQLRSRMDSLSVGEITALGYGSVIACYKENPEVYKHVVIYESMLSNLEEETKKLFQVLQLPNECIAVALTALQKHSQNNFFGSSALNKEELITDWPSANAIFEMLNVSEIQSNMSYSDLQKIFE